MVVTAWLTSSCPPEGLASKRGERSAHPAAANGALGGGSTWYPAPICSTVSKACFSAEADGSPVEDSAEAARAVGVALATNPWPLFVPCHRVVSAGDKMTGFSAPGGVRTKARLLVLEGAELLSE